MSLSTDPFLPNQDLTLDHDSLHRRYQLCRLGFTFLAVATFLRALDVALHLGVLLTFGGLFGVVQDEWYQWGLRGAMVAAGLVGPYLLWARWDHPKWMSMTGLLITAGLVDLVLWGLDRSVGGPMQGEHQWVRLHLARGVSWLEVGLGTRLVTTFLDHLERHQLARSSEKLYGFLATGVSLWLFYMVRQTAWRQGWPLAQRGLDGLGLTMLMAYFFPLALAAARLSILNLSCAREAAILVADWRRHLAGSDKELLQSRSELWDPMDGPTR